MEHTCQVEVSRYYESVLLTSTCLCLNEKQYISQFNISCIVRVSVRSTCPCYMVLGRHATIGLFYATYIYHVT